MSRVFQTSLPSSFAQSYQEALANCLNSTFTEQTLMQAYDLGRRAIDQHCNILDLVTLHQKVILEKILTDDHEEQQTFLGRGEQFLAEVMAPFEMMHRGFDDTIRQLQHVNETLEQRVAERTIDLERSKRKSANLARLYLILSSINSTIVRQHDRHTLCREACRITVEQGGYDAAWINLQKGHHEQATEIWCQSTEGVISIDSQRMGPISETVDRDVAQVYETKEPIVRHGEEEIDDVSSDTQFTFYALLPLTLDDAVVGIFAIFSTKPAAFYEEEIRLLLEMAGDLSFAIDHIRNEKQLNYLAYYDSLTGLPNRSLLLEHLPLQFKAAKRVGCMVALLLIDVMHFSKINDIHGRHVGDIVLKKIGERLISASESRETVARLGADCFCITFTGCSDTSQVAHRLEQEVLNSFHKPFVIEGNDIRISIQVGISLFPDDTSVPDTLLENGEIAVKLAKKRGETYLLYDPAMNERILQSVTMEVKLRRAIEEDQLLVKYQPKVSAVDGRLVGLEALVRFVDPDEGMVLPDRFIPLMEETGMIVALGEFVILRVIKDLQRWRNLGLDPPRIAVNVSPIQLRQQDFISSLKEILSKNTGDHGLDIEITESAVMEEVDTNIHKLEALRDLGFGIAIDDFGTGYSSLSYLTRLPVNTLKIDRSFIIDIAERPNSLAIVTTIITLAHSLEMKVVAEGVDQKEQAKLLRLLRCDLIQGNLFSPPLFEGEVEELLRRRHQEST